MESRFQFPDGSVKVLRETRKKEESKTGKFFKNLGDSIEKQLEKKLPGKKN